MARPLRLAMLHGFLGLPDDWGFLKGLGPGAELETPDLWTRVGATFDELVADLARTYQDVDVLGGYSMGGRLAMCAFLRPECRARALVVISAHPGGLDAEAREARLAWDRRWAARFETEAWSSLLPAWNALPVFAGDDGIPVRRDKNFDRHALAYALRHWSVAHQGDQRSRLRANPRSVLWLAGENDAKYAAIAREVEAESERITVRVLPGAGHRLLREAPGRVAEVLAGFLRDLLPKVPR